MPQRCRRLAQLLLRMVLGLLCTPSLVLALSSSEVEQHLRAGQFDTLTRSYTVYEQLYASGKIDEITHAQPYGAFRSLPNVVEPLDTSAAARSPEKPAARGERDAQFKLGELLWDGPGIARDRKRAVLLWRQAAAQKQARARERLAALSWWEEMIYAR